MKNLKSDEFPLISVLIATYNRKVLLARCLQGVFDQTYPNVEVIVVDDASTDKTEDMLKDNSRVIYLKNEKNKGISYNINKAASVANGEYFALLGDDDLWVDKEKLKKQMEILLANSELGFVTTYWKDIKNGEVHRVHSPKINCREDQILRGNGIYCGSTPLVSKEAWIAVRGFDESIPRGCDSDFFRSLVFSGYQGYILESYTTEVFIDDHPRMTPTNSTNAILRDIESSFICLKKFESHFEKYHAAKFDRIIGLVKKYIKLAFLDRNPKWILKGGRRISEMFLLGRF